VARWRLASRVVLRGAHEPASTVETYVESIAVVVNAFGVKANNLYSYADCKKM
jgi:hypothetical protein